MLPLLSVINILAASFDCAKATTKVEKMICADTKLSRLDKEIAAAYAQLLSLIDALGAKQEKKKFQELRKRWVREDEKCDNVYCLRNSYSSTLIFLQETIDNRKNLKVALEKDLLYGYCGNLTLARNCGDQSGVGSDVCEDYLDYLNTLKARPVCETPVPPQFKHPDWQELDVRTHMELAYQAECAACGEDTVGLKKNSRTLLPGRSVFWQHLKRRTFYRFCAVQRSWQRLEELLQESRNLSSTRRWRYLPINVITRHAQIDWSTGKG